MSAHPAERWFEVVGADGVRLSVREIPARERGPDAPDLLLHHGLASSQRIWDLMLPTLSRRHRVVTYDARGHGRSAKPSSGFGFDHTVADARAVIAGARMRRPVLVGHSWGAMVALELAALHPRSVRGVVLVDGGVFRMRDNFDSWAEAKRALAPPLLKGMSLETFRSWIGRFWDGAVEVTPEIEAIVLSVMRVRADGTIAPRLRRASHFKILHAIWEQDALALHRRLTVPAVAILARGDDPGSNDARRAAASALRAAGSPTRVEWIGGIHDLPLQHPRALAGRIERAATA
jgi:pimeloyl-ACP methyl ester carboxylesterase